MWQVDQFCVIGKRLIPRKWELPRRLIMDFMDCGVGDHTEWESNNRSVHLFCLYLFKFQYVFQMNTNIITIQIIRIMDIQMRPLTCLQSHLQISPTTAPNSYLKFQKFQNVHTKNIKPKNSSRGLEAFLGVSYLLFWLV